MDGSHFDALTRTLTAPISRRVTLSGLAAGVLVALGLALDETTVLGKKKNKGKGNKKKKNKKKKNCPPGRVRCDDRCCPPGQTCQGGQCRCAFGRPPCGTTCCTLGESCDGGQCVHHCVDGSLNGGEADTDCGRVCDGVFGASPAGRCGLRKRCAGPEDCTSGKCQEPQPGAGVQCVECLIDSDCGNPLDPRCLDNFCFQCAIDADCPGPLAGDFRFCRAMDSCPRNQPCVCRQCRNDGDCPADSPHCQPGTDSSRLSGICFECLEDSHCPADRPHCTPLTGSVLSAGRCVECVEDTHCPQGSLCDEQGRCESFDTCDNGVQDGDETDVDCGGSCPKCANSKNCLVNADCQSGLCHNGTCQSESTDECNDGSTCLGPSSSCSCNPCFCGEDQFATFVCKCCPNPPEGDCPPPTCPPGCD